MVEGTCELGACWSLEVWEDPLLPSVDSAAHIELSSLSGMYGAV